jgi:inner membrane protein involved in colicin E2 resistance
VRFDLSVLCVGRELRVIVEADRLGEPSFKGKVLEAAGDVVASKREANPQGNAFASEVIDDGDRSNISALANRSWTKSTDQRSFGRETGTTLPRV